MVFRSDDEDEDDGADLEIASDSAFDDNVPDEGEYGDAWRPVAESAMAPVYTQQLGVARLVGMISGGAGLGKRTQAAPQLESGGIFSDILPVLFSGGMRWATTVRENFVMQHGGLGALLHCLGTTESNEARKQCAVTIASLAAQMPQYKVAVLAAVGDAADGEKLLSAPEDFAEDLDIDPIACEKIAAAVPTQASLGTAGGVASSDQWSALPPMPKSVLMDDDGEFEAEGGGGSGGY